MRAEIVELMDRQVAQGALPAHLRVVLVDQGGVPPHRVHIAAQPLRPVDQRVDGIALGRLGGGAVRGGVGRHVVLRYRRGTTRSEGGPNTTVAQPAGARKGFGNTRCVLASGICQRLAGTLIRRTPLLNAGVDASHQALGARCAPVSAGSRGACGPAWGHMRAGAPAVRRGLRSSVGRAAGVEAARGVSTGRYGRTNPSSTSIRGSRRGRWSSTPCRDRC